MTPPDPAAEGLARVRALIRAGDVAAAKQIAVSGLHGVRAALAIALAEGRDQEAVDLARTLVAAGGWDPVVAATFVVHAPPDDPLRDRAALAIDTAEAATALAMNPSAHEAWQRFTDLLQRGGRADLAIEALMRATAEGAVGPSQWHAVILALVEARQMVGADVTASAATEQFPDDADTWAISALLACEVVDHERAERALERARSLASDTAVVRIAAARLAFLGGRIDDGRRALDEARACGADPGVVHVIERILVWVQALADRFATD